MKKLLLLLFLLFPVILSAQAVNNTVTLTAVATDITAAIGDTECGVASVQFFNGATALSPVITTPTSGNSYTFSWDTKSVSNGTYVITAKAIDKAGLNTTPTNICDGSKPNTSTSNTLNVAVNNQPTDTTGPSVTITVTITVTP
jgi:hypothetical protein